jgi:pilus assembly protein Flp/PilA
MRKNILSTIRRFFTEESGPTAVEYAVMLALIIVVCASTVGSVGMAAYKSLWEVVEVLDK